ncbi:histone-lysine N-methyltransferase SETMAR-like [Oratosquilla oratoria]|uniref:histone-lysine N-methyltransferase SETMAR-like n=1 Tax=Oratosquilla oratoria TaxID=337810 RepID=UPI003F75D762
MLLHTAWLKKWAAVFKQGRDNLEVDPRQGRPASVITQETIDKIHDILLTDRCLAKRFIETDLGISQKHIHAIMHNHLEMTKVPKLLGPDQNRLRCNMSKNNLAIFHSDPQRFIRQFVTISETWVHHFQPESREQSKQWKHYRSPAPKKANSVVSAGKDNAPAHKSSMDIATLHDCGFQLVEHPPYSTDLAPSDYHLFLKMKTELSSQYFAADNDVVDAVEVYLEDKDSSF